MGLEIWTIGLFIVSIIMGLVGSWFDNLTHNFEVPNKVWLVFGIGGFIVAGFRWGWIPVFLISHLIFALILSGGVYLAYWLGKGAIGGADVKAIMALSVTLGIWSFLPLLIGLFAVGVYGAIKWGQGGKSFEEIINLKAPFLPFLTFGIVGGFIIFLGVF